MSPFVETLLTVLARVARVAQVGGTSRCAWGARLLWVGALLVLPCLTACASDVESARYGSLLLRIQPSDGSRPTSFVIIVTDERGVSASYACGAGVAGVAAAGCEREGLRLLQVNGRLEVTVKARGYSFWNGAIDPSDATCSVSGCVSDVALTALAPFEHTADYDTGFEPDGGLEAFGAAAVMQDTELGSTQIVKFYITDLTTSPKVYFQNTKKHPLHYTFARDVLHRAMSRSDFEAQTYHGVGRTAMAGSILYRRSVTVDSQAQGGRLSGPISVTFFPSDDLTAEQALMAQQRLEERLGFAALWDAKSRVVYEPAGTVQEAALARAEPAFAASGSLWVTTGELYGSLQLQLLNPGVAYGTLRLMTPEELDTAVVSYTDLLVLTRLPIKLPIVGGTITEELQTPLSHVNVAARTRGTPNIALRGAAVDPRIAPYLGKLVRFEVGKGLFALSLATVDEAEAFWQAHAREPLVPSYDDATVGLPSFDDLGFSSAESVGVKAANLAELSQLLGSQAPEGFAVPFHYYDQFMRSLGVTAEACQVAARDCLGAGRTEALCESARDLCVPVGVEAESFWDYVKRVLFAGRVQADSSLREAALSNLRYLMRHTPVDVSFANLLDQQVNSQFLARKVRIRSSTNAEDLQNFSGAGLYDSFSANSAKDGPASEEIRKVWASVWNFSAYEERAYWNIDHLAVRMGCAIHQAFSTEAANGVIITQNIAEPSVAGLYVNVQKGEVSVTNPTSGALPEVFSIVPAPTGVQVQRQRFSSLSPNVALLSEAETTALYRTVSRVHDHFAGLYGSDPGAIAFDIEFKFNEPDRSLIIKQLRPYTANVTE